MPQTLQKALAREDRAAATDLALLHQLTGDYKGAKSPNRTIVGLDLDDKPWYLSVLIVISLVWSLGKPELSLGCPLPLAICARLLEIESSESSGSVWSAGPPEPKSTLGGEGARFLDEERELQRAKSFARRQPEPEVRRPLCCRVVALYCRALLGLTDDLPWCCPGSVSGAG